MASSIPFLSIPKLSFLLLLLIFIIIVSPSSCFSLAAPKKEENGLRISLQHVDSGGNFTKFERIQRAMKRGRKRLEMFKAMVLAESDTTQGEVKSTIYPGNGEFLMKLSIGTPPVSYSAIMDTGSDLIWTQCKPCQECFDQPSPLFDPEKSSSFSSLPCSSKLCESLPMSSCTNKSCEYLYTYGDYSFTQGVLATETFTFNKVSLPNIGFGCGEDNEGSGFNQGSGLVGLGRGPLSLVSQLSKTKFSYCLTSIEDDAKTSILLMGPTPQAKNTTITTTSLIKNPTQPSFYYLTLEGIKVGDTQLPIKKSTFALNKDGSGGLIIDSGTTISYLEESAFDLVKKEFISQTKLSVDKKGSTGLDLCFTLPSDAKAVEVPKLVLRFEGGDLELPSENYMISDTSVGLMCLAMGSSSGMSILGNVQQQNLLVVHDLAKETISFVPTRCDEL